MPEVIIAAAEGEACLYQNVLSSFGASDKHRGSVEISGNAQMFRAWTSAQASDDMWFHTLCIRNDGSSNSGTGRTFINIYNENSQFICGCHDVGPTFSTEFSWRSRWATTRTSGDVAEGSFTYSANNGQEVSIDIRVRLSTVSNPNDTLTVDWYFEQQLRETRVITDATGWVRPGEALWTSLQTNSGRDTVNYKDLIITDAIPTVGMELVTLVPSASGFYSGWTNNYTNIDEAGYDPDDLIFSTTAANRESWILETPTFDTSDKIIYGFVAQQVVQTDLGAVVSDFRPFLRINATDYDGGLLGANSLAPDSYIYIWTTNPATAAPWTQEDFNGLEVGLLTVA